MFCCSKGHKLCVCHDWWWSGGDDHQDQRKQRSVCAPHTERAACHHFASFCPHPALPLRGFEVCIRNRHQNHHCHHQDHLPYHYSEDQNHEKSFECYIITNDVRFYFTHDPRLEGPLGNTRIGWPKKRVGDPYLCKYIWCNKKVNTSFHGNETTTLVFPAILVQFTKYGEICTIVLLFMFNFLPALFLTLFKVAGLVFLAGRDFFVKYFPKFSVRLVCGESFLNWHKAVPRST